MRLQCYLINGQNRVHPEAWWPNSGTPFHASPRAPSYWRTPAQTRLWTNFKRVHLILATHPPIGYPISITPTRLWPGYLYALHIFKSEKNASALKLHYYGASPTWHAEMFSRCRLFSGGFVHSFREHLWSRLIHVLLFYFFSGQAFILSFVVAVVAVRRQMRNSSPSRVF